MGRRRAVGAFDRPRRVMRQRKLYVVVGEGAKTERQYFDLFHDSSYAIAYSTPRGNRGGNMRELVREMGIQKGRHSKPSAAAPVEYWIVADMERESVHRDLSPLLEWVGESPLHHLALTNRQIENWLLLHFRKGMASADPVRELARYIPGYDAQNKGLAGKITVEHARVAVEHAKVANVMISDRPVSLTGLPVFCSSMPVLVERLLPGWKD